MRFARIAALVLVLTACTSSHAATTSRMQPGGPSRTGIVTAAHLPERLKIKWAGMMLQPESKNVYGHYRVGTWKTPLAVFGHGANAVYVDAGGGGMAFSLSCGALDGWVRASAWHGAYSCSGM